MPKIKKETIKQIPKIHSLKIYKKENRNNYYCSFYVGTNIMKSGNKEISLYTENVKEALKKARNVVSNTEIPFTRPEKLGSTNQHI